MRNLLMMLAVITAMTACSNGANESESEGGESTDSTSVMLEGEGTLITTPTGVEVLVQQEGDGVRPQVGQKVTLMYVGMLSDGSVFDQSMPGNPMRFVIGSGQGMPGWHSGIAELSKGAIAKLRIPADQAFGSEGVGDIIPPNEDLLFDVEILDIQDGPKPIAHELWDTQGLEKKTTNSGLEFYIIEEGTGEAAEAGKTVAVHYYGILEDGTKFDASYERGEPIEFQLGAGMVIPGWEEGISQLREGSKAQLVIPPYLAYGEQGAGSAVPPNATLIFDVEVVAVR